MQPARGVVLLAGMMQPGEWVAGSQGAQLLVVVALDCDVGVVRVRGWEYAGGLMECSQECRPFVSVEYSRTGCSMGCLSMCPPAGRDAQSVFIGYAWCACQ